MYVKYDSSGYVPDTCRQKIVLKAFLPLRRAIISWDYYLITFIGEEENGEKH